MDVKGRIAELEAELAAKDKQIAKQTATIAELQTLVAQEKQQFLDLQRHIADNFDRLLIDIVVTADLARCAMDTDNPSYADLEEVMQAVARAADMIRQLRMFARKRMIWRDLIAVNDVILNIQRILRPHIHADIEMVTLLSAVSKIAMDPNELEQIIVALVVNGAWAMPNGGKLTIETYEVVMGEDVAITANTDVPAGAYVGIRVHDTGVGMSPEVKECIFEPFFTTKDPGEGMGIGLSIVHGTVTRGNGHIMVESTPGKGTTFDILLPVFKDDDADSG